MVRKSFCIVTLLLFSLIIDSSLCQNTGPGVLPIRSLLDSLKGPAEYMKEHPLPDHLTQPVAPRLLNSAMRPLAPENPTNPTTPSEPSQPNMVPQGSRLLPNMEPMGHSMMMPLVSLPAILENPSRLFSGIALAPLWESSERGMTARNTVFGGMNLRARDETIHENLLAFVMARQLGTVFGKMTIGADFRNNLFDWYKGGPEGLKATGV
eukprot:c4762_g1_i1.p1 GENE.c4762_g1_i1~~c4762_g1_i1.p1  ORF type:complete len:209 (-),score=87.26 c4762_g1_i1:18-644(-)